MSDQGLPAEPPSGQQFQLTSGLWRATVTEVGAGLRMLSVDGRELVDGYSRHVACTGARGLPLITSFDRTTTRPAAAGDTLLPRLRRWSCREQSERHVLMGLEVRVPE